MFDTSKKETTRTLSESILYWLLLSVAILTPFVAYVTVAMPAATTKIFVGGMLVLAMLVFFAVSSIRKQSMPIPHAPLLLVAWLVPLAYFLSTVFASDTPLSFFGRQLSMDSMAFMTILMLALTVTALVVNSNKRALGVYLAMLGAAAALTIVELVIFFARESVAATGIILPSLSLLGSLNDLAVFFGLIVIFVLLSVMLLPVSMVMRAVLTIALVAALFFVMVVNLPILWWIVGLFALGCFVYSVSAPYMEKNTTASLWHGQIESLAVVVVSGFFLFGSVGLTSLPAAWAQVGELDVRPSWQTTASLGRQALAENTIFGAAPGSFTKVWAQYMPSEISQTAFWQADFQYGIGLIPTSVITTGLIGALAWLIFFGVLLLNGARSLMLARHAARGDIVHYLRLTSFFSATYLWIIAVIQVPSPVLMLYASILTGLFVASLALGTDAVRQKSIEFRENPRIGFAITLLLTFAILASVGGMYGLTTRFVAASSFQKAVVAANQVAATAEDVTNNLEASWELGMNAVRLSPIDTHYRLLSNIDMVRIQQLMAQNRPVEEIRDEFTALFSRAKSNVDEAIRYDANNYQNWLNAGTLYQGVVPWVGVDAADKAQESFDAALALRPSSPFVYLAKASLERAMGNTTEARLFVEQAIGMRNQYSDAIFFLAQLQLEENDTANAIQSVEAVTLFEPTNPVAFFQLGLLHYGSENYTEAAQAFGRAVSLNDVYANARYFLGLTHWRLGNTDAALAEFTEVLKTNPDSVEVQSIVTNLQAGRAPFTSVSPSADIQDLETLPVDAEQDDDSVETDVPETLSE